VPAFEKCQGAYLKTATVTLSLGLMMPNWRSSDENDMISVGVERSIATEYVSDWSLDWRAMEGVRFWIVSMVPV